jgi:hypothetical protein
MFHWFFWFSFLLFSISLEIDQILWFVAAQAWCTLHTTSSFDLRWNANMKRDVVGSRNWEKVPLIGFMAPHNWVSECIFLSWKKISLA